MARNTRGGLGRGLSSLMGSAADGGTPAQRTKNRERVVYDEREELYATGEINLPNNRAGQNEVVSQQNVSRETVGRSNPSNTQETPVIREDRNNPRMAVPQNTGQMNPVNPVAQVFLDVKMVVY